MALKRLSSICTTIVVGLACKSFLKFGCKSVTVDGLHHLQAALADQERKNGRGIVTVSNHISTADDPMTWGVLPFRHYVKLRDLRWSLGAHDIIFTNPVFSTFFRLGQVLETFRGNGVYQEALDIAIEKLDEGNWIHLFGEGKINQPWQYELLRDSKEASGHELVARLPRFKWGTGRILMETQRLPVIIPMWLSGFENIMPEPMPPGLGKFLPRPGHDIKVTFAPPLDPTELRSILDAASDSSARTMTSIKEAGAEIREEQCYPGQERDNVEERRVRQALTAVIQKAVEQLGYNVSGPLLGQPHEREAGPKSFTP